MNTEDIRILIPKEGELLHFDQIALSINKICDKLDAIESRIEELRAAIVEVNPGSTLREGFEE